MEEEKLGTEQANDIISSIVDTIDTFVKAEVSNLKDRVQSDLQTEVNWRKSAIKQVDAKIQQETAYRIGDVNNERDRAKSVEGELSDLQTEDKSTLVGSINSEVSRAKKVEGDLTLLRTEQKSDLVSSINSEKSRAESAESSLLLRSRKIADWSDSNSSPTLEDVDKVNSLLGMEIVERTEQDAVLAKAITDAIDDRNEQNESLWGAVRLEAKNRSDADGDLSTLKTAVKTSLVDSINAEFDYRVSEIERVDDRIDQEIKDRQDADLLDVKLSSEEQQTITSDILLQGQLTVNGDVQSGSSVVIGDMSVKSINTLSDNGQTGGNLTVEGHANIENGITINGDTSVQNGSVYVIGSDASKNVSITDGQIHAKDVVITGDLTVLGETITTVNKTLEVDDNLIVTRASSTSSPTTNSGLVISINNSFDRDGNRENNSSIGLVYNPTNDSVDLAIGSIVSQDTDNEFVSIESNPIVIRQNSSDISNNRLVVWEKTEREYNGNRYSSVRAVDSGKSIDDFIQVQSDLAETIANLSEETTNRLNSDLDIMRALEAESNTRQSSYDQLQGMISDEESRAKSQEEVLSSMIGDEENRAKQEESDLSDRIDEEVQARANADADISRKLATAESDIIQLEHEDENLYKYVDEEILNRQIQDATTLQQAKDYTDLETARALQAEKDIEDSIDGAMAQVKAQVMEDLQPILQELEESADFLKLSEQVVSHINWSQSKLDELQTSIGIEQSQRADEDAEILVTISNLQSSLQTRYDPSKEFYEKFLLKSQANPGYVVAPAYDSENMLYTWEVVRMDEGEID